MNLEQQQGPRVDISATTPIVCECGNNTFTDKMYLRKESRLMSGLPEDRLVPIQLVVCEKCGKYTYRGCGEHLDTAFAGLTEDQICTCQSR